MAHGARRSAEESGMVHGALSRGATFCARDYAAWGMEQQERGFLYLHFFVFIAFFVVKMY
jgi:hypothetical protein